MDQRACSSGVAGGKRVDPMAVLRRTAGFCPGDHEMRIPAEAGILVLDAEAYFALANTNQVSSMRFEKPHSLSYQDDTFTSRPDTLVSVASNEDEAGS